jgi:hypothetical protein
MLAYCGLTCEKCPIHLATIEPDKTVQRSMRESIAKQCASLYGMNLTPEEISDCDGCRADSGRIFAGCLTCSIRKCAIEKKIETCAYRINHACETLKNNFSLDPDSQVRLEELRTSQ